MLGVKSGYLKNAKIDDGWPFKTIIDTNAFNAHCWLGGFLHAALNHAALHHSNMLPAGGPFLANAMCTAVA
jgi:hypothetical protein